MSSVRLLTVSHFSHQSSPLVGTPAEVRESGSTAGETPAHKGAWRYPDRMAEQSEFEFVFEPQDEGGHHVYAPDLPGLHTQGQDRRGDRERPGGSGPLCRGTAGRRTPGWLRHRPS
jgi:hypothetical protein